MQKYGTSFWKATPFLRILLPLVAGIITRFYVPVSTLWMIVLLGTGLSLLVLSRTFSTGRLFTYRWVPGVALNLVFFTLGCLLLFAKDARNDDRWIGKHYQPGQTVVITILEPPAEKERTWKALAKVEHIAGAVAPADLEGNILVYFKKDSAGIDIGYGSQLLVTEMLQPIRNTGNPGGFDYRRYCAFSGIYYQVVLDRDDYRVLPSIQKNVFKQWLIDTREWVLSHLKKYIAGPNELAVAEALLIGYKDDLDKELVQSYSNTGVVHVIAISGLHLGMIYGLMIWLFAPYKNKKWCRVVRPLSILAVIWTFTFLAGAVPSILRSAVMFTCIIAGEALSRKRSMYNTLAGSAFILLVWNPFYLWDIGFQLSYAAVLSIVVFSRHVHNWFYFQNRLLRHVWGLSAVTLAAQVLTLPVVLYHFNQFPNLFLFTNVVIVPLSGLVLFAELLLMAVSFIPGVAVYAGKIVEWLTWLMNTLIERTDRIPFAVSDGIRINLFQSILIYLVIASTATWLLEKNRRWLVAAAACMAAFILLRSIDLIRVSGQQKLIVYNVPRHTAIDVIEGDSYRFIGDDALSADGFLRNFHLRPSRIANNIREGQLNGLAVSAGAIKSGRKSVVIIDRSLPDTSPVQKTKADAIIITGNPRLYIGRLVKQYDCNMLVFDASNPSWKIRLWKKDCDSLHLPYHSVPESGAFEMEL